jgi:hypothetical protein
MWHLEKAEERPEIQMLEYPWKFHKQRCNYRVTYGLFWCKYFRTTVYGRQNFPLHLENSAS